VPDMGLCERPIFDSGRVDLGLIDVLTVLRGLIEEMRRDGREVSRYGLEAAISLVMKSNLTDWTVTIDGETHEVVAFNRATMTIEVARG